MLLALALYAATLLPGIGIGDTAEFQRVAPALGIAHPTGYPLYTLLGWLWSHLPLGRTPAWRMNLLSALAAALAVGVVYLAARALGQRGSVAAAAALTLATALTFWTQATIAEVYALALLLQALLFLALLRWRAGRWPFWIVGLIFGLGLAHHRSIILLAPGALLFVVLTRRPRPREVACALAAMLGASLLYLYLPLRAPPWDDPWQLLWNHATGAGMAAHWFDPARLLAEGWDRPLYLARAFVWPQFLPVGALLALLGAGALVVCDRACGALLILSYGIIFSFCSAYYVIDVDAFLLPAHLIAALLLGQGAMLLLRPLPPRVAMGASVLLLLIPAVLVGRNFGMVRAANSSVPEQEARAIMAQALPANAVIIDERNSIERLRYLQEIEGRHPGVELRSERDGQFIRDRLAEGRAIYLLEPDPLLGLAQWPEGRLWRVSPEPLVAQIAAPDGARWAEGIALTGYTLAKGPYPAGETVPVVVAWQAQATPQRGYTLFVHIVDQAGKIWGQHDRAPAAAPTNQWQPGEGVIDIYGPVLDPATPPGRYRVVVGWYDYTTLQRLLLLDGDDALTLGEIEVQDAG